MLRDNSEYIYCKNSVCDKFITRIFLLKMPLRIHSVSTEYPLSIEPPGRKYAPHLSSPPSCLPFCYHCRLAEKTAKETFKEAAKKAFKACEETRKAGETRKASETRKDSFLSISQSYKYMIFGLQIISATVL